MTNSDASLGDIAPRPQIADLADQATTAGKDLKAKAVEIGDSLTRVAKDQAGEVGNAAKELATDATARVQSVMEEQKAAGADFLGSFANTVRRAAGEFEGDTPQAAAYIRRAAGQMETVANAVRERNVRELIREVEDLARRQPTLFFGGAMILGFAALRFFKSSSPDSSTSDSRLNADEPYRNEFQ
jgi:hypothetical protein